MPWCTRIRASVPACSLLGGCLVHARFTNILTRRTIFPYRTYPRLSPVLCAQPILNNPYVRGYRRTRRTCANPGHMFRIFAASLHAIFRFLGITTRFSDLSVNNS